MYWVGRARPQAVAVLQISIWSRWGVSCLGPTRIVVAGYAMHWTQSPRNMILFEVRCQRGQVGQMAPAARRQAQCGFQQVGEKGVIGVTGNVYILPHCIFWTYIWFDNIAHRIAQSIGLFRGGCGSVSVSTSSWLPGSVFIPCAVYACAARTGCWPIWLSFPVVSTFKFVQVQESIYVQELHEVDTAYKYNRGVLQ